ncbi:hypothetical protein MNEG_2606 [Monoraphidium neglectum]|uniref:Receptor ligand binding region domain-containing protein n=1 Tax=Monoraphidium neglectum TaxID=145388 RepID=A0A0D2K4I6_9CHLO|nr:hypothetical protein MNEG_2606 [Monoraphidium neglectum]KIZ05358.1 hypothetical protein MNEG_2606 [Monoraphidium neglectum]|eukprot:XP_013904377.1 hypothetical protein MNEG_2606 [Monoraphidium neglectum]
MVDARSGLSRCSALLTAALLLHLLLATTADATSLAGSPSPGPRAVGLPVLPLVAPGAAARAPPANTTAAAPGVSPVQARQPAPAAVAKAVPKPAAAAASVNGTPVATVAEAPAAIGSRGELRIGCIVPLTGSKANTGRAVQAAVEMAIRDVGAKKLPGVNIVLTCEDTKCTDVPALYGSQKLARSKVGGRPGRGQGFRQGGWRGPPSCGQAEEWGPSLA